MNLKSNTTIRKKGRKHGEVFTNMDVINYILDDVEYISSRNLSNVKILEPAAGLGSFAVEIIFRLYESSLKFNFPFINALLNNLRFVELDETNYERLTNNISKALISLNQAHVNVAKQVCCNANFLLQSFPFKFDCIVGNPPYIRHELIPQSDKEFYRKEFSTFKFRADLYVLFYEHSLELLNTNGKLSFICSNRWLNNQYGINLRQLISSRYNLINLLNIENSSPFDEDVIAYPCITTISNSKREDKILVCIDNSRQINFKQISFIEMFNPVDSNWQNLFLDYDINHHSLLGITEQNFKIGIGVATGLDKIFIRKKEELNGIESERIIPLIKSSDLKNNEFKWGKQYLINPYENNILCDLDKYPHLKNYFLKNKELLLKRHTTKKAPQSWYKTIDKINPDLVEKPKLLLPDISNNKFLFIDEGNFYPHHNLYYITGQSLIDLKILATVLMSDFVKNQISKIGLKMNGGIPRLQTQLLKKLKIPVIASINFKDKEDLIRAYDKRDLDLINNILMNYCI